MTIEEQFDLWWKGWGSVALVADSTPKDIARMAYRAALLADFGFESVGHQSGFHNANGGTTWREAGYWNGQRADTSREIFVLVVTPPEPPSEGL